MDEPIFSPDGKFMWTGKEWIPAPPRTISTAPQENPKIQHARFKPISTKKECESCGSTNYRTLVRCVDPNPGSGCGKHGCNVCFHRDRLNKNRFTCDRCYTFKMVMSAIVGIVGIPTFLLFIAYLNGYV